MFKELIRIYDYREMLKNSVRKELRSRYKKSILGFFWTFLNPLLQLLVYSFVFNSIMGMGKGNPDQNYTLLIFVGLVPWTCISSTINQSTTVIVANGNLIKKIYFPRLILPLSMTLTNFINMLLTEIIVFAAVLVLRPQAPITIAYLFLPLVFLAVFLLSFSIAVLLSALTVYFRDLEHIFGIITMFWFYMTPIIYPLSLLTDKNLDPMLLTIYKLNPTFGIIDSIHQIMLNGQFPVGKYLIYDFAFSLVMLVIALTVFDKCQRRFAEEI